MRFGALGHRRVRPQSVAASVMKEIRSDACRQERSLTSGSFTCQPDDKTFLVPNLKIKTVLHLQCCGDDLSVIRALDYFRWSVKTTVFADGVNAIVNHCDAETSKITR